MRIIAGSVPFPIEPRYLTSFSLCDSPPDSVFSGCPRAKYPSPTSCSKESFLKVFGKKSLTEWSLLE